jgi:hypothetical protein
MMNANEGGEPNQRALDAGEYAVLSYESGLLHAHVNLGRGRKCKTEAGYFISWEMLFHFCLRFSCSSLICGDVSSVQRHSIAHLPSPIASSLPRAPSPSPASVLREPCSRCAQ